MKSCWILDNVDLKLTQKISKSVGISALTATVLTKRGITNEAEALQFLRSSLFDIPSPYLMKGMDEAVKRVKRAIEQKEKIAIYGDYDVDGITATSLFYSFLMGLGADVMSYNPERVSEGYGINFEAVKKLKAENVSLIVSGDCGITAYNEVEGAKKLNIDFIITDHHKPPEKIPNAVAVLNPNQADCTYPFKEITGVGVIYNLAIALRRELRDSGFFENNEPNLADYLDLVALGTVADCAPLRNVNRIFVKEGIKRLANPKRIGVRALKEVSSVYGKVNSYDISFKLSPRLNASGRLASADLAVKLFLSDDFNKALDIASELNRQNSMRQSIESKILEDAISQIESNPELLDLNSIVLASSDWHQGVIGIVASRLVERYQKPSVIISIEDNGICKGSARSVENINIYEALSECREVFEHFGGHKLAAGITIKEENIEKFKVMFNSTVQSFDHDLTPKIRIDADVEFKDITNTSISELGLLEPYGIGNPEPVFVTRSVDVISQKFFKDKHLGLKIRQGNKEFDGIWFNVREPYKVHNKIDVVFTPEFNHWNGKKEIRLRIKDID